MWNHLLSESLWTCSWSGWTRRFFRRWSPSRWCPPGGASPAGWCGQTHQSPWGRRLSDLLSQEDIRQGGMRQEVVKTETVEQMIISQEPARNQGPSHQHLQMKPSEGMAPQGVRFVFNQQHEGEESLLLNWYFMNCNKSFQHGIITCFVSIEFLFIQLNH